MQIVTGFIDSLSAGRITDGIEIFSDRCLAIGHHCFAGQFLGIDEEAGPPFPRDRRTVMGVPLAIHPEAQSNFTQELDRAGLQHAGANSLQHMSTALPFQ